METAPLAKAGLFQVESGGRSFFCGILSCLLKTVEISVSMVCIKKDTNFTRQVI